ncbi:MAG: hypothetical protein F6K11_07525 [Leptolyngbya sp. SIO3F4]|nr:hypothetical protein [Leptolyngbya sp. SIO3F4]
MVQFSFTYDPGISVEQRTGFELAARIWGAYLTDDIVVNFHIASVDQLEGNAIGGAAPFLHEQNYGVFTQYLENDATSSSIDQQALDSLQDGNTVDVIVDGEIIDGNSKVLLTSAQAKALGMDEALVLENGSTWDRDLVNTNELDGYIVINQSYTWNYDFLREGTAPEKTLDFLSLAMHEIGHQLGFVSGLDGLLDVQQLHSGEQQVEGFSVLDLFRHTVESSTVKNPDGAVSDLSLGSNAYFSVDGGATELGLFSTGQSGDGLQAGHWKRMKDALGIMDPTLAYKERLSLTKLDLQALDALGYDVNYEALNSLDIKSLLQQVEMSVANQLGLATSSSSDNSDIFIADVDTNSSLQDMTDEQWWQIFEQQLSSLDWKDWWQILDVGFGVWFQQFGQSMIDQGYGQWWQIFEQNLSQGWNTWFQKFEATVFDLGYGQWWQLLDLGNATWWQELEPFFLTLDDSSQSSVISESSSTESNPTEIVLSGKLDDIIAGSESHDRIYAGDGDDLVDGKAGDDQIWGGAGQDIIYGHDGNDKIYGGIDDDLLMGEIGNDRLHGGDGHDILSGGEGRDILKGNRGNDDLRGGADKDILSGNDGNDRLQGGTGDDLLIGGEGHDEISGGQNNDIIFGDAYASTAKESLTQLKQQIQQQSDISANPVSIISSGSDSQESAAFENLILTHLESNVLENLTTQESENEESDDETSPTPSEPTVLGAPIRIEAESMSLDGYRIEYTSVASSNSLIRTYSNGTATTSFKGDTGYYNIVVAYYDENDGLARLSASLAGVDLDDWQLNQNLGSYIASTNNLVTRTIATQIQVNTGDVLELQGLREYNEFARIDYVEFVPVSAPAVSKQAPLGNGDILQGDAGNDILFGGEDNDLIYGESQADNSSSLLKGAQSYSDIVAINTANSDILVGGIGNDTLYGNAGNDTLYGDNLEDGNNSSLTNGLVGHWQFDETTGTQASDSTGNHSGILTNMASNQWTTGHIGGALAFDGHNDRVIVADSSALDITNTLTLATWVKADSFQAFDGLITKGTSTISYGLDLDSDGSLIFSANYGNLSGASGWGDWDSNTRLTTGQWHHVAVTYDGSYVRFYIDGQLDSNVVQTNVKFGTSNQALILGAELVGSHFDGALDDARVYNRALNTDEIITLASLSSIDEGSGGNDTLVGGIGNDTLVGGAGNDSLSGTDTIAVGSFEQDKLTGGSGSDTFILGDSKKIYYQGNGNHDYALITDFNSAEDLVVLHGIVNEYTQQQQGNDTYLYANSDLVAVFKDVNNLNPNHGVIFA